MCDSIYFELKFRYEIKKNVYRKYFLISGYKFIQKIDVQID